MFISLMMGPNTEADSDTYHDVRKGIEALPVASNMFSHRSINIELLITCASQEMVNSRKTGAQETDCLRFSPSPSKIQSSEKGSKTIRRSSSFARDNVKSINVTSMLEFELSNDVKPDFMRAVLREGVVMSWVAGSERRERSTGFSKTLPQCRSRCCAQKSSDQIRYVRRVSSR